MMAEIFVHIGLHKTGTTSIQATLFNNRETLLGAGLNYLAGAQNHSRIIVPVFSTARLSRRLLRRDGVTTKQQAAANNVRLEAELKKALAENTTARLVISGEDISTLEGPEIERMRDVLAPHATRIRIIVYVRDPFAVINSRCQARLQRGDTYADIKWVPYYRRIAPFINVFGRENVDIREFDPSQFAGGELITDFLTALGAADLAARLRIIRVKQSLSHEASFLLREVNRRLPPLGRNHANPARAAKLHALLTSVPGQAFQAPHSLLAAAERDVSEELRWLRGVLGREIFPQSAPEHDLPLRWSDDTLVAIALLINDLALNASREPAGFLKRLVSRVKD